MCESGVCMHFIELMACYVIHSNKYALQICNSFLSVMLCNAVADECLQTL